MSAEDLPFPLVVAEGPPLERGIAYGSTCRERIRATIEFYRFIFQAEGRLDWDRALRAATSFAGPIHAFDPDIMEEIRGIAQGAKVSVNEILAINVRSELLFLLKAGAASQRPCCTALAAVPTPGCRRPMLMAQNWDWYRRTMPHCVMLLIRQPPRPTIVQLVEAGLIAKMGMNAQGIGLCTNALLTDGWRLGVPYHAILRGILNASCMADAIGAVTQTERASAGNYLIGHREGLAVDIEASPGHTNILHPANGVLTHTNHFIVSNPVDSDLMPNLWPDTIVRDRRSRKLCGDRLECIDVADLQRILTDHFDHPSGICTHPSGRLDPDVEWQTNVSMIMDLNQRTMLVSHGPACENGYRRIDVGACFDADGMPSVSTP